MLGEGIEQLRVFAVFVALGVGFCCLYIFCVGLTRSRLAAIIFDSLFGALCLYVVWKVNLEINNGECRAFLFVGLALGSAISFVTCKSTLDKLSSLLYNLLTIERANNGTHILQKMVSSNIRNGDTVSGGTDVHATGESDADVVTARPRRRARETHRRSEARRTKTTRTARIHAIKRVRQGMGRTKRPHQR
ncbi:MAG: spore cortex biosynthesis protein YabQ [Clostridiales bacterium]|nr:spore cortex biosynthesis protein YabQ [Clostridiales bacterium]